MAYSEFVGLLIEVVGAVCNPMVLVDVVHVAQEVYFFILDQVVYFI